MSNNNTIPRIRTVQIKNYKSLVSVSVDLEQLTVLVGPNASGKSNFIDALAFIQECLWEPPEVVLARRGGILAVLNRLHVRQKPALQFPRSMPPEELAEWLHRYAESAPKIGFRVIIDLAPGVEADYSFELGVLNTGSHFVNRERCVVQRESGDRHIFEVVRGKVEREIEGIAPQLSMVRLALPLASATKNFQGVSEFLSSMRFYSIVPEKLRKLQEPDPGFYLKRDGSNAAAVLRNFGWYGDRATEMRESIARILSNTVAGLESVQEYTVNTGQDTLEFIQKLGPGDNERFTAAHMSDGTLRILGLLLALYQPNYVPVVGIEEPEATVNPGIAETVFEVLQDAAYHRQVIVTTHSPDILDNKELKSNSLRVVQWHKGCTIIAPISQADRETIRENLYTAGELLRIGELDPDHVAAYESNESVDLFDSTIH